MTHLPFLQHLASIGEGSADWDGISLAFRALVLIDARATSSDDSNQVAIGALRLDAENGRDDDSIVDQIRMIAALLSRPDLPRRSHAVSTALLALTVLFRRRCLYELARDTAQTALRQAPADSDAEWLSHRECGVAAWSLGNFDQAAAHYGACIEIGERTGSLDALFWGRNGECLIVNQRGNLPRAERLYRRLVEWGRRIGRPDIEAHARHGLGITLGLRGRVREGLEHLQVALPASTEPERLRVLTNIAYMRLQLGEHEEACNTFLEVVRTTSDRYEANVARVNLIEVYAAAGARDEVESCRRFLEREHLSSALEVDFHMTLGRAYLALRDPASAAPSFRRAAALAERAGLGRDVIEADRELERLSEAGTASRESRLEIVDAISARATDAGRRAVRLQQ